MKPPTTEETREIHELYCRLTKLESRYSMQKHFQWESWLAQGYTREDLALVIAYIWRRIKAHKREKESFKLCALIDDKARFEDDISMARSERMVASKTVPMPPSRASTLRSTGRPADAPSRPIRTPADVIGTGQNVPEMILKLREAAR